MINLKKLILLLLITLPITTSSDVFKVDVNIKNNEYWYLLKRQDSTGVGFIYGNNEGYKSYTKKECKKEIMKRGNPSNIDYTKGVTYMVYACASINKDMNKVKNLNHYLGDMIILEVKNITPS